MFVSQNGCVRSVPETAEASILGATWCLSAHHFRQLCAAGVAVGKTIRPRLYNLTEGARCARLAAVEER